MILCSHCYCDEQNLVSYTAGIAWDSFCPFYEFTEPRGTTVKIVGGREEGYFQVHNIVKYKVAQNIIISVSERACARYAFF